MMFISSNPRALQAARNHTLSVHSSIPVRPVHPPATRASHHPRPSTSSSLLAQTAALRSVPRYTESMVLYDVALHYARSQNYKASRVMFERLLRTEPHLCKAWVSYAQMSKRQGTGPDRFQKCREVLQRGLQLNPSSSCLIQAWGLMELQRGNFLAALMMLERCARMDPSCSPVLKWHQVDTARKTVGSRRRCGPSTSTTSSS